MNDDFDYDLLAQVAKLFTLTCLGNILLSVIVDNMPYDNVYIIGLQQGVMIISTIFCGGLALAALSAIAWSIFRKHKVR